MWFNGNLTVLLVKFPFATNVAQRNSWTWKEARVKEAENPENEKKARMQTLELCEIREMREMLWNSYPVVIISWVHY